MFVKIKNAKVKDIQEQIVTRDVILSMLPIYARIKDEEHSITVRTSDLLSGNGQVLEFSGRPEDLKSDSIKDVTLIFADLNEEVSKIQGEGYEVLNKAPKV